MLNESAASAMLGKLDSLKYCSLVVGGVIFGSSIAILTCAVDGNAALTVIIIRCELVVIYYVLVIVPNFFLNNIIGKNYVFTNADSVLDDAAVLTSVNRNISVRNNGKSAFTTSLGDDLVIYVVFIVEAVPFRFQRTVEAEGKVRSLTANASPNVNISVVCANAVM